MPVRLYFTCSQKALIINTFYFSHQFCKLHQISSAVVVDNYLVTRFFWTNNPANFFSPVCKWIHLSPPEIHQIVFQSCLYSDPQMKLFLQIPNHFKFFIGLWAGIAQSPLCRELIIWFRQQEKPNRQSWRHLSDFFELRIKVEVSETFYFVETCPSFRRFWNH